MIPTNLAPGTEIVCIDDESRGVPICLVKNRVYTVRGYVLCHTKYVAVLLEEELAHEEIDGFRRELGFYRDRFRLLEVPSIFTEMLDSAKLGKLEPV